MSYSNILYLDLIPNYPQKFQKYPHFDLEIDVAKLNYRISYRLIFHCARCFISIIFKERQFL